MGEGEQSGYGQKCLFGGMEAFPGGDANTPYDSLYSATLPYLWLNVDDPHICWPVGKYPAITLKDESLNVSHYLQNYNTTQDAQCMIYQASHFRPKVELNEI